MPAGPGSLLKFNVGRRQRHYGGGQRYGVLWESSPDFSPYAQANRPGSRTCSWITASRRTLRRRCWLTRLRRLSAAIQRPAQRRWDHHGQHRRGQPDRHQRRRHRRPGQRWRRRPDQGGATGNTIGGIAARPAAGNVISGNTNAASTSRDRHHGNLVAGNLIGTNAAGTVALGNGGDGIDVIRARDNTIGGTSRRRRQRHLGQQGDGV